VVVVAVVAVVAVVTTADVVVETVGVVPGFVVTDVVVGVVVVDVDVALPQDDNIADTASKQLNTNQRAFLGIISLLLLFFNIGNLTEPGY
jgi:2-phosphoglycerate kinase